MILSILIPTYNNITCLNNNYNQLCENIYNSDLSDKVKIIISNNNSTDGTFEFLENMQNNNKIVCEIHQQCENIGAVKNVLFLLNHATTDYILFLGDDDFLHPEYLTKVISSIKNKTVSAIIPSNKGISETGEETGFSRDINLNSSYSNAGFETCLNHSWRGHQLSGLVFKRSNLYKLCIQHKISNKYLFIFLVSYSALQGNVYHLTEYPVLVTRPPQKTKGWSYGNDGLVSDIFDNYSKLPYITSIQRSKLELKILDDQYWRYMMYLKLGVGSFIKTIMAITFGKNTSIITRILFPVLLPYFLIKRSIILLLNGELHRTLTRPVDI